MSTATGAYIGNGVVWHCADFDGETIDDILLWVYCRHFRGSLISDASLGILLSAARLWMYPALVREIERELVKRMTPVNVFKIIPWTHFYKVRRLFSFPGLVGFL